MAASVLMMPVFDRFAHLGVQILARHFSPHG